MRCDFTVRGILTGLAAGAFAALLAMPAVPASAEPMPVQIVQASDGTLYLVQGANSWLLVPDQVDLIGADALPDLGASGEIDGTIPPDLIGLAVAPLPASPDVPAAAPPPAPPAPPPAPAAPPPPINGSAPATPVPPISRGGVTRPTPLPAATPVATPAVTSGTSKAPTK